MVSQTVSEVSMLANPGSHFDTLFLLCFLERARTFWAEEDVEQVFNGVFQCLDHLKRVLQMNTATDKGWPFLIDLLFDSRELDVICFLFNDHDFLLIRICSGAEAAAVSGLFSSGLHSGLLCRSGGHRLR